MDKPGGLTSHDVVARVRRLSGERRVGHGGTLDPLATGVLPVVLGAATRLVRFLPSDPKVYDVTIRLGLETTTGDIEGEPLAPPRPVAIPDREIEAALPAFEGPSEQVPPMFSAKKVGGRPLYRAARAGLDVPRRPVPIRIDRLRWLGRDGDEVRLEVTCSPGTYVRSLAVDLGRRLGTLATVSRLRRTRSGVLGLENAASLGPATSWDELQPLLVPIDRMPLELAQARLEPAELARFCSGQEARCPEPGPDGALVAVRDPGGRLEGIGQWSGRSGTVQPRVVLARADGAK